MNNLTKEDLEFLTDLANEMKSQNNRATGSPYYYTIRKKKTIVGMDPSISNENVFVREDGNDYEEYKTEEDAIKELIDEGHTEQEAQEYFDKYFKEYGTHEYYEEHNVFLTHKGVLDHIRLNGHNLSRKVDPDKNWIEDDDLHSYVNHAFRNPEMKRLVDIILKFSNKGE